MQYEDDSHVVSPEPWHYDDKLTEWCNGYKKRRALKNKQTENCYVQNGIHQDSGFGVHQKMIKKRQKSCGMMSELFMPPGVYQIAKTVI